jgi:hypothetical protein
MSGLHWRSALCPRGHRQVLLEAAAVTAQVAACVLAPVEDVEGSAQTEPEKRYVKFGNAPAAADCGRSGVASAKS